MAGGTSLEIHYLSSSSWKSRNWEEAGVGRKGERKAQSEVLHWEESDKYGGDTLKYGSAAFKMAQRVGD